LDTQPSERHADEGLLDRSKDLEATSPRLSKRPEECRTDASSSIRSRDLETVETKARPEKSHLVYYDFDQGSDEWIKCRNNFITASAIGQIVKGSNTAEYRNLLAEKASNGEYRSFFGNDATRWGHKYEPVADLLYEYRNPGVEIYEYGLIHNPNYPNLGVSPDGITNQNEMLEIKCPYSRKINGVIKKEYAHQIQQQLLVCEHEICNFLECKFVEVERTHFWSIFALKQREKGIIIQSLEQGEKYNYYSPIELSFSENDLQTWYQYRLEDIHELGGTVVKETYWLLDRYNCQKVKKDPDWYPRHKPMIEKFWVDVDKTRSEGWQNLVKKKGDQKSKLSTVCLLP
jgi:putative phage-type endonuclease